MKLKTVNGDIFKTDAQVIAHGCNTVGAMGAGIAIQFRVRFPKMFREYQEVCLSTDQTTLEGSCWLWRNPLELKPNIACLFTQYGWRADLNLIEGALKDLRGKMLTEGLTSLALPAIGCGVAKTKDITVDKVQALVDDIFGNTNIETTLYLL